MLIVVLPADNTSTNSATDIHRVNNFFQGYREGIIGDRKKNSVLPLGFNSIETCRIRVRGMKLRIQMHVSKVLITLGRKLSVQLLITLSGGVQQNEFLLFQLWAILF